MSSVDTRFAVWMATLGCLAGLVISISGWYTNTQILDRGLSGLSEVAADNRMKFLFSGLLFSSALLQSLGRLGHVYGLTSETSAPVASATPTADRKLK